MGIVHPVSLDWRHAVRRKPFSYMSFAPILVGGRFGDRARAAAGAAAALALVGLVSALLHGDGPAQPWIAAPIAASAVLVFVVPASPLAQPWPTIGGNVLSALVGVLVGRWVGHGAFAAGLAGGAAILVMSLTRSLHPPAAAAAMGATLSGSALSAAFAPLAVNAIILVALGWLFHRTLTGHAYPHRPIPHPELPAVRAADIEAVLAELDEPLDIGHDDVVDLVEAVLARSLARERA
jgi:CBS domain-containing membrane protein